MKCSELHSELYEFLRRQRTYFLISFALLARRFASLLPYRSPVLPCLHCKCKYCNLEKKNISSVLEYIDMFVFVVVLELDTVTKNGSIYICICTGVCISTCTCISV